jgi:hypothetical protein
VANDVNYNTAYNFVKKNYSKVSGISDLRFVLRTPTLWAGSQFQISDCRKCKLKSQLEFPIPKPAVLKASSLQKDEAQLDVDLHLRLAQNRAKQKRLDKRLLLRGKDSQASTPHIG